MATQQGCHAGSPRRGAGHCRPLQASQRAGSGPYQHRRSQSLAPFSPLDDARLPRFGALVATGWPPHDFLRIRRHWAARFVERAGGCSPSASPLPRPYPSLPSLHLLTSFLLRAVLNCPFCWCFSSAGIASSCPLLSVAPLQRAYPRPALTIFLHCLAAVLHHPPSARAPITRTAHIGATMALQCLGRRRVLDARGAAVVALHRWSLGAGCWSLAARSTKPSSLSAPPDADMAQRAPSSEAVSRAACLLACGASVPARATVCHGHACDCSVQPVR